MNWTLLIRQTHRWLSIVFVVIVATIFTMQGLGKTVVQWVYFTPLSPLFLMTVTGLYLFILPYAAKWGARKP